VKFSCCAAILFAALGAFAQTPVSVEATACVFHEGDDPRWGQPGFDDRDWPKSPPDVQSEMLVLAGGSMAPHTSEYLWQRCHVNLEPLAASQPLFVILRTPLAWRLFLNGREVGIFGNPESGRIPPKVVQGRPIPPELSGSRDLVVAMRFTRGPYRLSAGQTPLVGPSSAIEFERLRELKQAIDVEAPVSFAVLFSVAFSGILLVLWWAGRDQVETLWLSMVTFGGVFASMAGSLLLNLGVPIPLLLAGRLGGEILVWYAYVSFTFALAGRRVPRMWLAIVTVSNLQWVAQLIPLAIPGTAAHWVLWNLYWEPHALLFWNCTRALVYLSTAAAFWPVWKLPRGEQLVRILSLSYMVAKIAALARFVPSISRATTSALNEASLAIGYVSLVGFLWILSQRFRTMTAEREDLRAEMKSAREIQRLLVPEGIESAPGFVFDAAYIPAKEVGGDFYQSLPGADGSLLIVTGDVSGKGLHAAMVVATVVGALRNETSRRPAEVLAHLNRSLLGRSRGGFVTCACALVHPDGRCDIANAGHLLPFLDGHETEVESSLPLGIIADVVYPEASLELGSNTLTFVSDGVVEAANVRGELFGFDRAGKIAGGSASEIAEAARVWGQTDDITVVTVRRAAAHAAAG
jgi:hypothetical protein